MYIELFHFPVHAQNIGTFSIRGKNLVIKRCVLKSHELFGHFLAKIGNGQVAQINAQLLLWLHTCANKCPTIALASYTLFFIRNLPQGLVLKVPYL